MIRFDLDGLRSILVAGGSRRYWRHDVDADLAAAVMVAEIEHALDIEATYFLWLRSPFYNLCGPEGALAVRELRDLGHKVGLHVDLGLPRGADVSDDQLLDAFEEDYAIAFEAFGDVVNGGFSLHKPPYSALWRTLPGVEYAYDRIWEGCYVSDSRRELPGEFVERLTDLGSPLQISLHPEHWVYPDGDWQTPRDARHRRAFDELMDRAPSSAGDMSARAAVTPASWTAADRYWPYSNSQSRIERLHA